MCGVNSMIFLVLTGLNACSGSGYYAKCCSNCRISANKLDISFLSVGSGATKS